MDNEDIVIDLNKDRGCVFILRSSSPNTFSLHPFHRETSSSFVPETNVERDDSTEILSNAVLDTPIKNHADIDNHGDSSDHDSSYTRLESAICDLAHGSVLTSSLLITHTPDTSVDLSTDKLAGNDPQYQDEDRNSLFDWSDSDSLCAVNLPSHLSSNTIQVDSQLSAAAGDVNSNGTPTIPDDESVVSDADDESVDGDTRPTAIPITTGDAGNRPTSAAAAADDENASWMEEMSAQLGAELDRLQAEPRSDTYTTQDFTNDQAEAEMMEEFEVWEAEDKAKQEAEKAAALAAKKKAKSEAAKKKRQQSKKRARTEDDDAPVATPQPKRARKQPPKKPSPVRPLLPPQPHAEPVGPLQSQQWFQIHGDAQSDLPRPTELPVKYHHHWVHTVDWDYLAPHVHLNVKVQLQQCYRELGLDPLRGKHMMDKVTRYLKTPGNSVRVHDNDVDLWKRKIMQSAHDMLVYKRWGMDDFNRPSLHLESQYHVRFEDSSTKVFIAFCRLIYKVAKLIEARRLARDKRYAIRADGNAQQAVNTVSGSIPTPSASMPLGRGVSILAVEPISLNHITSSNSSNAPQWPEETIYIDMTGDDEIHDTPVSVANNTSSFAMPISSPQQSSEPAVLTAQIPQDDRMDVDEAYVASHDHYSSPSAYSSSQSSASELFNVNDQRAFLTLASAVRHDHQQQQIHTVSAYLQPAFPSSQNAQHVPHENMQAAFKGCQQHRPIRRPGYLPPGGMPGYQGLGVIGPDGQMQAAVPKRQSRAPISVPDTDLRLQQLGFHAQTAEQLRIQRYLYNLHTRLGYTILPSQTMQAQRQAHRPEMGRAQQHPQQAAGQQQPRSAPESGFQPQNLAFMSSETPKRMAAHHGHTLPSQTGDMQQSLLQYPGQQVVWPLPPQYTPQQIATGKNFAPPLRFPGNPQCQVRRAVPSPSRPRAAQQQAPISQQESILGFNRQPLYPPRLRLLKPKINAVNCPNPQI